MTLAAARDPSRAPSIPDVLAEHLEELGFLSLQRRKLLFSEECTPRQYRRHTRRIEAHWAALNVASVDSVKIARTQLEDPPNAWAIMACARAWIELGNATNEQFQQILEGADHSAAAGWREALRWIPARIVGERFPLPDLSSISSMSTMVLLDAHSWHGLLPLRRAEDATRSELPFARRCIARHASRITGAGIHLLDGVLEDDDETVRRAAHWSLMLIEPARAFERARRLAQQEDPFAHLLLSLLEHDDVEKKALPTIEDAEDQDSMAMIWRRVIRAQQDDLFGQRREVPDGFFTGLLSDEAVAGE